jgi:hypothetical protein
MQSPSRLARRRLHCGSMREVTACVDDRAVQVAVAALSRHRARRSMQKNLCGKEETP